MSNGSANNGYFLSFYNGILTIMDLHSPTLLLYHLTQDTRLIFPTVYFHVIWLFGNWCYHASASSFRSLKNVLCSFTAFCSSATSTLSTQLKTRARTTASLSPESRISRTVESFDYRVLTMNNNNKKMHNENTDIPCDFSSSPSTIYWAPIIGSKGSTKVVCIDTWYCTDAWWDVRMALDSSGR